jgi:RAI1 like PD-(D/E)XK nuclease
MHLACLVLADRVPGHAKAVGVMYKEKHPRWWVQSFLAGVDTLVLGGRDHNGQLLKVCLSYMRRTYVRAQGLAQVL